MQRVEMIEKMQKHQKAQCGRVELNSTPRVSKSLQTSKLLHKHMAMANKVRIKQSVHDGRISLDAQITL